MKMRAVIFDMDGVLVDSEPYHERAFHAVCAELGYGPDHGIEFGSYVGRSDTELWRDFVEQVRPAQTFDELLDRKRQRVIATLREHEPIFAGVAELVAKLRPHFKLAVASGSEHPIIDAVLGLQGLRENFPVVVSGSDVARGKPAPDIFLRTAGLLGVRPEECWVIEDSKPGVTAALAAGMKVIAITNTHPAVELAAATHVVADYADIARLMLGE
jgi:HAD superfamily hydrolase (TIGR01509 family)